MRDILEELSRIYMIF